MENRLILRTHKNAILGLINDVGLDPTEFEWIERPSRTTQNVVVSEIRHRPTGFYFTFDYTREDHYTQRSPGRDAAMDTQFPGDWRHQLHYATEWVGHVRNEYTAPDLWAALVGDKALLEEAASERERADVFSEEEKQAIANAMREIAEYSRTILGLTAERLEVLEKRVEYLTAAVDRLSPRDWLHTAVGVFATVVVGLALAPEQAGDFFRFAWLALQRVFGHPPLLP